MTQDHPRVFSWQYHINIFPSIEDDISDCNIKPQNSNEIKDLLDLEIKKNNIDENSLSVEYCSMAKYYYIRSRRKSQIKADLNALKVKAENNKKIFPERRSRDSTSAEIDTKNVIVKHKKNKSCGACCNAF